MKVLLSIKPEFVERILNGTKKFEFRKGIFKKNVTSVVIYATMPIGMVVGEFEVDTILSGHPEEVWDMTEQYAGISKNFFDEYYEGREKAFAIKINKTIRFDEPLPLSAIGLNITPPQSYRYL